MPKNRNQRIIDAFEVYFRRDGEKRSVLKNSLNEVNTFRAQLDFNKRKFLGYRQVKLVEVS
jgi:hypothetical protein